jgi:Transposase DDE domain/Transposase domain (DUF772)
MPLRDFLSDLAGRIQGELFPFLRTTLGPLSEKMQLFVTVLEMTAMSGAIAHCRGLPGRPASNRVALARAFVAKAVLGLPTTVALRDRLLVDRTLRQLCGWDGVSSVPGESTFSRAFAEFAHTGLAMRVHEALIARTHKNRLVGHISRDATAIEAREEPVKVEAPKKWRRKKRPEKGVPDYARVRRLERQQTMTIDEMLRDLPTHCAVGMKSNSRGYRDTWIGYKLHIDTADGDIPIAALLTSASMHDSQAAIPLATITASRVTNLYDLMDSAYDAPEIAATSRALGRVPIIQPQARRDAKLKAEQIAEARARKRLRFKPAEAVRLNERASSERVNARLKDDFGGRFVRVRGHAKVACHLFFGLIALAADQIMRLIE